MTQFETTFYVKRLSEWISAQERQATTKVFKKDLEHSIWFYNHPALISWHDN